MVRQKKLFHLLRKGFYLLCSSFSIRISGRITDKNNSFRHKEYFQKKKFLREIIEIPLENLAKAIEYGVPEEDCLAMIREAVKSCGAYDIDTAVLACTHYPLAASLFKEVLPQVRLIDPAESTVTNAIKVLR